MGIRNHKYYELLEITVGIIILSIAFHFFFSPSNIVIGGVMGLSIIVKSVFNMSPLLVSIFIFSMNIILLIVGGIVLGKGFFLKTIYGTLLFPALTALLTLFKVPEDLIIKSLSSGNQILISSISGGLLLGLGLGLVLKNNATTGGIDVVQKILNKKLKVPYSFAMYITDGLIILLGMFHFGFEIGFFALSGLLLSGLIIDRVILAGKQGFTVFIVTNNYEEIKVAIYQKIRRGITKISVVGGFTEHEKNMIVCTISKSQLYALKGILAEIDPNAFSFITKTSEALGQGFK